MRTRFGLVLGAGGVLGASWAIGALSAWQDETGFDARDADVLVGTSAGSVLAAALGCGVPVADLVAQQRGLPTASVALEFDAERAAGGSLPPMPRLRMGSPKLLAATIRAPRRVTPIAAVSAFLPQGRGTLEPVERLVTDITDAGGDGAGWASHSATWIVACDYATGRRVVFGRDGSPAATLPEAVVASCSIPGWYAPKVIGRRRYVDGGICTSTSWTCSPAVDWTRSG